MVFPYSDEEVEELARKTVGLDEEPDEPTPATYLALFTEHVQQFPYDTNFIIELAEPGKKGSTLGGNGFGVVTCMEDDCWKDVILSADPRRPEGGKQDGIGSFSDFQDHCQEAVHIKGRSERCKRLGISMTPVQQQQSQAATSIHINTQPILPHSSFVTSSSSPSSSSRLPSSSQGRMGQSQSIAGPSRHPQSQRTSILDLDQPLFESLSSSSTSYRGRPPQSSSPVRDTMSPSQQNTKGNPHHPPSSPPDSHRKSLRDIKPLTSQTRTLSLNMDEPIVLSDNSDSDDEIQALHDSEIPEEYKKVTNVDNPIILTDDSDVDEIAVRSRGKGKAVARTGSSQIPLAPIFGSRRPKAEPQAGPSSSASANAHAAIDMSRDDSGDSIERGAKAFDNFFSGLQASSSQTKKGRSKAGDPSGIGMEIMSADERVKKLEEEEKANKGKGNPADFKPDVPVAPAHNHAVLSNDNLKYYETEEKYYLTAIIQNIVNRRTQLKELVDSRLALLRRLKIIHGYQPYMPPVAALSAFFPELKYYAPPEHRIAPQVPPNPLANIPNAIAGPSANAGGMPGMPMPGGWQTNDDPPFDGALAYPPGGLDGMGIPAEAAGLVANPYEEFGYEYDRPTTSEGLATFFSENLNDFIEDTTVDESLGRLGLQALTDHLPGLRIQLMPHQVLGVDFMLKQEKNKKHLGGINGDAMGLGKTVQSIALLAANPSQDPKIKTTLIIAPLALLTQWKSEIESKCTPGLLRVLIYHGQKRPKSANMLKQYDVVLTTYGTLTSEFGTDHTHKPKVKIDNKDASDTDDDFKVVRKQGPLFKVKWYRCILDEAHIIRNKNTRATKACFALESHYRWCLTGTPIMNSLDDLYPLLHFLCISPSRSWEHFRDHISKVQKRKPKLAMKRSQAIIRSCCIRRNKDSELNGKKLLELPPKETEVVTLDFTDEERQIYTAIENRFQVRFNSYLRKGTVMKHYSIMLVMLMRLRQLTDHPWLLRRTPGSGAHQDDVIVTDADLTSGIEKPKEDNISEMARASTLCGIEFVERIKNTLSERQARINTAALANDEEGTREGDCSVCFDAFTDERVTACGHSFCAGCLQDIFNTPAGNTDLSDEDVQAGRRKCPMCRTVMDKARIFRAAAFLPEEEDDEAEIDEMDNEELDKKPQIELLEDDAEFDDGDRKGKRRANGESGVSLARKRSKRTVKGEEKAEPQAGAEGDDDPDELDIEDVRPSTKMKRLGELIDQIGAQDPNQKIIVFSQFVQFIDLCALYLTRRNVKHVQYVGSMNQNEREEALQQFNRPADEDGSPKVILMSLKCGGVGLNLCVANHVICLDLAWNAATENQAVDRAHRIGQIRNVHVHRLVIENTVEQRIMALQESKQALSDGAMGEGTGGRLGRLSVGDLMRLFGVDGGED
ncbi:hypothetical protein IAT40_007236 [Kwoniella sp. CBS 6097]